MLQQVEQSVKPSEPTAHEKRLQKRLDAGDEARVAQVEKLDEIRTEQIRTLVCLFLLTIDTVRLFTVNIFVSNKWLMGQASGRSSSGDSWMPISRRWLQPLPRQTR